MKKVIVVMIMCAFLVAGIFTGCQAPATTESASESAPVSESVQAEQTTEATEATDMPVVGISTGFTGSSWRNQMSEAVETLCKDYVANGVIKEYKVVNNVTDGDAAEQSNIIRDFINEGVDIILLNPNSSDSLNEVLHEAQSEGILVVAYDSELSVNDILTVTLDQYQWMEKCAGYLCDTLKEGNVIQIYGMEGHSGNIKFMQAAEDAVAAHPDIKLIASASGSWDETKAKEAALQLIGAGQQIDGVLTQVSMGYGCLSAFVDSNKTPKIVIGDPGTAFFKLWKQLLDEGADFQAVTMSHPPGISATALKLAVQLYNGRQFKDGVLTDGKYLFMPDTLYTNDNFDEGWALVKDMPDDYFIDDIMTDDEVDALFQ